VAVLHTHLYGSPDAPPALALHGVTGHGARFRRLAVDALPGYRVLAPDLRGHGHSTWDPPWDAATHLADLLETMDAHEVERCLLLGHSFGGMLATRLAAAAPDRFERVVLLDPAIALSPAKAAGAAADERANNGWATSEAAHAERAGQRPEHARAAAIEDVDAHLEQSADGRWRFRVDRCAAIVAWSDMARALVPLGGYDGRVLLMQALQADFVTPELIASLRDGLGGQLEERPIDVGHMLYWDAFDETADALRTFLAT